MQRIGGRRAAVAALVAALGAGALTATPAQAAPSPSATAAPAPSASAASPAPTAAPASPAPVGTALEALPQDQPLLTLPAGDGLRDRVRLRIRSGAGGDVDVLAKRGARTERIAEGVALRAVGPLWQRTVDVRVKGLTKGSWTVVVRRAADPGVRTSTRLVVGSGAPVQVSLTPQQRTLYPYRDRVRDTADVGVVVADETGAALPVRGTMTIEAGGEQRTRPLATGVVHVPVTGLPLGPARVTATITGPAGTATRTAALVLAPTGVGALRLSASTDTVQPVVDGLLDAVVLTTSGSAVAESPAKVSGVLTVSNRFGVLKSWKVADGTPRTFTWNGRVNGVLVPGTYTATLTLTGPEGAPRTRSQTLTVSKDHLPYRVRDLFAVGEGNQQGLAVHDGLFYVATDVGAGSSRIDVYDGRGALVRTLGSLPIGHGAALSFSTTTGLLYAANGGPTTPTTVWALDTAATDPVAMVKQTIDLSALGPNGMVAVDDAGGRLLVFAGTKGAYTLSSVGFDGAVQRTVPIAITGVPQGIDMVGAELWLYTSLSGRNRLARYTVTDDAVIAASTGSAAFDLMNPGEGEGFASAGLDGAIYVGAHGPNRVGVLEPVADE